ncbi:MAG: DNA-directed RNA polymerase subunit beta', partial [Patescibacteria group bacterium]
EIIVRNEKRMLQEAVDGLIDSSKARRGKVRRGKKTLRSFADLLSGKQGRFRQNLLGKRVDYSGRSVVVVGPHLKLNQVGIPREMALELWKPHVLREILLRGSASNLRSAKTYLEERSDEVWEILEQLVEDHPVLLNRAPSLHRLSILGFYPVLVDGSAIQLHPNVCAGFNADFDGDAMAVHLPISKRAIEEVKKTMISTNNLLRPATGEPIAFPNKEQVLGTYYLTSVTPGEEERKEDQLKSFGSESEALLAYDLGKIFLRERIKVAIEGETLVTTVGRVIFNAVLPDFLRFHNGKVGAKEAKDLISKALAAGQEDQVVADLVDAIKELGFHYAAYSGVSISVFDGVVPPEKPKVLAEAERKVIEIDQNFRRGLITDSERRELSRVVWAEATSTLDDLAWDALGPDNPIKLIIASGAARATRDQVKQISGMRGHVVDPTGKVVELPIRSNYREGLTSFEYFVGARGARKGLVDTALRTADAGYLTRRLVDVAQDVLIREADCKTKNSISLTKEEETFLITFARRLNGRTAAEDVKFRGKVLIKKNELIDALTAEAIETSGITEVKIRSPLTCESRHGVCAACYGLDLGRNRPAAVGIPVGLVAAQSVGEPGTQLTLRTKHAGGIATSQDITQGLPRIEEVFEARTPKFEAHVAPYAGKISVSEEGGARKIFLTGKEGALQFDVPVGRGILVKDGEKVESGRQLTEGYLDPKKILGVLGITATQKYLVNEILKVYSGQGISLDDIHLEIIVRQMFNKVRVTDPGGTQFIPEEVVTKIQLEQTNAALPKGAKRATGEAVLLGITRSSLKTDSWLSAASFMETTRILTEAAASGKVDKLIGLKENVIVGRLIPTGERAKEKDKESK